MEVYQYTFLLYRTQFEVHKYITAHSLKEHTAYETKSNDIVRQVN